MASEMGFLDPDAKDEPDRWQRDKRGGSDRVEPKRYADGIDQAGIGVDEPNPSTSSATAG
jgi:hypothetical protein